MEDIGELTSIPPFSSSDFGNILVCKTDRSPCCAKRTYRFGEWTHNNTNIGNRARNEDYFQTRDDIQQIHLSPAEPCMVVAHVLARFDVNCQMLVVLHRCNAWR